MCLLVYVTWSWFNLVTFSTVNHCEFTYTLKHTELANYHIHAYSRFVLDWLVHLLALSLSFKKFEQE